MGRSLALIAVGTAVAVAVVIVVAGVTSKDAGEAPGSISGAAADALPSGHPSVAATDVASAAPAVDGGTESTIARLEELRAEDPDDVAVLLDLGEAYFLGQHLRQAETAYAEVIDREPDNAAAQVGLAMVWHAEGESKRARYALRKVLDAHPDDQEAHYALAIVCFSSGRVDEARAEWRTAAAIDPSSTTGRRSQSFVDLLEESESSAPAAEE